MNIHVTEIVEQVANAHRIDRSGADAGTDVAIERNHTPFVKLRPRCLHVLYDDALFFRKKPDTWPALRIRRGATTEPGTPAKRDPDPSGCVARLGPALHKRSA
jgi:hypothetical protein